MAEIFVPFQIATFVNDATAVSAVNNNFNNIAQLFNDVLSRIGVSPNQMGSTLDMNGNQIINLPPPQTLGSPARLADVVGTTSINQTLAPTGTSGHVVPFLDGINTWSNAQTLNMPTGSTAAFTINSNGSGTIGSAFAFNSINVNTDAINAGSNFVNALQINDSFGGSSVQGGRQGIFSLLNVTSATNATNPNRNYTSISGSINVGSSDGGTSPSSSGTSQGIFLSGLFNSAASSGATALQVFSSGEFNTNMASGTSTWMKTLVNLAGGNLDVATGSVINSMLYCYNLANTAKWSTGILFDNLGGLGFFPIANNGTIIKTTGGSVGSGIDFALTSFTTNAFASPGFSVSGTGAIASGGAGISSGSLSLFGTTSGSMFLGTNSTGGAVSVLSSTNNSQINVGSIGVSSGTITLAGLTSGFTTLTASATGGNLQVNGGANFLGGITSGLTSGTTGFLSIVGSTSGNVVLGTLPASGGMLQFASTGSFSANGSVATTLGSLGPAGAGTSPAKWLTIVDNGGVVRYIPCF